MFDGTVANSEELALMGEAFEKYCLSRTSWRRVTVSMSRFKSC